MRSPPCRRGRPFENPIPEALADALHQSAAALDRSTAEESVDGFAMIGTVRLAQNFRAGAKALGEEPVSCSLIHRFSSLICYALPKLFLVPAGARSAVSYGKVNEATLDCRQ